MVQRTLWHIPPASSSRSPSRDPLLFFYEKGATVNKKKENNFRGGNEHFKWKRGKKTEGVVSTQNLAGNKKKKDDATK